MQSPYMYIFCAIILIVTLSLFFPLVYHEVNAAKMKEERLPFVKDNHLKVEEVAEGLRHPTSMLFLDQRNILVLEKDKGTVLSVSSNGTINQSPLLDVNVATQNERGMLGIAAQTSSDGRTFVFLYFTESSKEDGEDVRNGTCRLVTGFTNLN